MRRILWAPILILMAVGAAGAGEDSVVRFTLRFEQAELRIAADHGVTLVGFSVPDAAANGGPLKVHLVAPARFRVFRPRPHIYQISVDGESGRFWRLDTHAGRAWLVTDGAFGFVGGTSTLQPWFEVQRWGDTGGGTRAVLRDLELAYDAKKKSLTLLSGGLELATKEHMTVEARPDGVFHIAAAEGWDGAHLEVDVSGRKVRFVRAPAAADGSDRQATDLELPLGFWLAEGRYAATDPKVPRLLSPRPGALLDSGRTDMLDPQIREFRWSDVPGATAYEIYVRNSGEVHPDIEERTKRPYYREERRMVVGRRSWAEWYWKVRALRGKQALPWSQERPFTVEPWNIDPPDGSAPQQVRGPANKSHAPRLVSPKPEAVLDNGRGDGADPLVWDFRWARMPKVIGYELVVLRDTEYPVVRASVKGTKFRFESRSLRAFGNGRTKWHWRVRGIRKRERGMRRRDALLPWSEASPFTLEPLDTDVAEGSPKLSTEERRRIPRLVSPKPAAELKNGSRNRKKSVTWLFKWTSVPDAEGYEIQLRRRGAPGGPRTVRREVTSYRFELDYEVRKRECYGHTWRVRAIVDGVPQPWSETRTYDIRPPGK